MLPIKTDIKNPLVLALDISSRTEVLALVDELHDNIGLFKVGKQLFTTYGPDIVEAIIQRGGKVFLDLKFHDIPNTVAAAACACLGMGISMFNIHTLGGQAMMRRTAQAISDMDGQYPHPRPPILGVTVLTSLSAQTSSDELHIRDALPDYIVHLAHMAQTAGLDGVVCSPQEIMAIKQHCGPSFVALTPGIRPKWAAKNDQVRITTPAQAIIAGADYIVVGRPILHAKDRAAATQAILEEINTAL